MLLWACIRWINILLLRNPTCHIVGGPSNSSISTLLSYWNREEWLMTAARHCTLNAAHGGQNVREDERNWKIPFQYNGLDTAIEQTWYNKYTHSTIKEPEECCDHPRNVEHLGLSWLLKSLLWDVVLLNTHTDVQWPRGIFGASF